MNEQAKSLIRTLLKAGGTVLVTKGITDDAGVEALVGGLIVAIGIVWSLVTHKKQ